MLLYRRFMVRVAEALARVEGARALVTGESLGQVASQTLENIAAVDAVATLPVFRPLIGSDKQEIVAEARALGTYELSIATDDDCCTLFMPRTAADACAARGDRRGRGSGLDIPRSSPRRSRGATHMDFPSVSYRAPRARQR